MLMEWRVEVETSHFKVPRTQGQEQRHKRYTVNFKSGMSVNEAVDFTKNLDWLHKRLLNKKQCVICPYVPHDLNNVTIPLIINHQCLPRHSEESSGWLRWKTIAIRGPDQYHSISSCHSGWLEEFYKRWSSSICDIRFEKLTRHSQWTRPHPVRPPWWWAVTIVRPLTTCWRMWDHPES